MRTRETSAFENPAFGSGHAMRAVQPPPRAIRPAPDRTFVLALFCLALAFHVGAVAVGWKNTALSNPETQTAFTAFTVQRNPDFSLFRPTPTLSSSPISVEFPLYPWTVASVGSASGLSLIESARTLSCACFYLALPAFWLLFARLHLTPSQRLLALAPLLTCPLLILQARTFQGETMALMFGAWFLYAFVAGIERRNAPWITIANLTGAAAGLVNITAFVLFLAPAAVVAAVWLWQERPRARYQFANLSAPGRTFGWIAAAVVVPLLVAIAWMQFVDASKVIDAGGHQLTSAAPAGDFFASRLSAAPWLSLAKTVLSEVTPFASLGLLAGATALCGALRRRWVLAAALLFLAAAFLFPNTGAADAALSAVPAAFLMAAAGLALAGLLEADRPRWLVWTLVAAFHVSQVAGYFHFLYPAQSLPLEGGSGLTQLLRDVTDRDDVLILAGDDESSAIPFYAERRALMIRRPFASDHACLDRAFARLQGQSAAVLILVGKQRNNLELLARAGRVLDLDPAPLLRHGDETVYVSRVRRTQLLQRLFNLDYDGVAFANPAERLVSNRPEPVATLGSTRVFAAMSPVPLRYQVPGGLRLDRLTDGRHVFDARPPARLSFSPSPGTTHLFAQFGVLDSAFQRTGQHTDGVEFAVVEQRPDGTAHTLFARLLDPVERPADRGRQQLSLAFSPTPGAEIVFETRAGPAGDDTFDWAFWEKIELR